MYNLNEILEVEIIINCRKFTWSLMKMFEFPLNNHAGRYCYNIENQ